MQVNWKKGVRICWHYIKGPLQRLFTAVFILAAIAGPSLYIYNNAPAEYTYSETKINYENPFVPQKHFRPFDPDFNFTVLIDVHRHPNGMDPDTVLQWHIAAGYNAVVITEHNDVGSGQLVQKVARERYNDTIKVIVGEEWTNCRMHMGMLGLKQGIPVPKDPTDENIQQYIADVHAQGGLTVVNHIPWSYWAGLDEPSSEDLIDWGVDFFDVTTYERLDLQTIYYARDRGVRVVAGTDAHELSAAHAWTLLYVDPNNFTEEAIMDALRYGNTSFIFDEIGYQPPTYGGEGVRNKDYIFYYPWIKIGEFFHSYYNKYHGQYSFVDGYCGGESYEVLYPQIRSSVLWMFFGWLFLELGWAGLYAIYNKIMDKIFPYRAAKRRRRPENGEDDAYPLMDLWDK